MSSKSGVKGRRSDRLARTKVVIVTRWCVRDKLNQKETEQDKVDRTLL